MSVITLDHVTKKFGDSVVVNDISDEFRDGEFITLLGPSGCGKTTMLRMIAGFEKPTSGEIRIDGKVVSSADTFVPPEKRELGMVFQSYAVWPHLNVFANVAYPLKIRKVPKAEIKEKILGKIQCQYQNDYPSAETLEKKASQIDDYGYHGKQETIGTAVPPDIINGYGSVNGNLQDQAHVYRQDDADLTEQHTKKIYSNTEYIEICQGHYAGKQ